MRNSSCTTEFFPQKLSYEIYFRNQGAAVREQLGEGGENYLFSSFFILSRLFLSFLILATAGFVFILAKNTTYNELGPVKSELLLCYSRAKWVHRFMS